MVGGVITGCTSSGQFGPTTPTLSVGPFGCEIAGLPDDSIPTVTDLNDFGAQNNAAVVTD